MVDPKTSVNVLHCETEVEWIAAQIFCRDALGCIRSEDVLSKKGFEIKQFEGPGDIIRLDGQNTISMGRAGENVRYIEGHLNKIWTDQAQDWIKKNTKE